MSEQQLIEFQARPDLRALLPPPYPASRYIPQWYRTMPMQTEPDPEMGTLRHCMPFLDAMTAGYIIPIAADITITRDEKGQCRIDTPDYGMTLVSVHPVHQYAGAPFAETPLLKFANPWIVKTPPGYSTLFVAPLNRLEPWLRPLTGIVETDTYYHEVNFPTLFRLPQDNRLHLARGSALIQAIPFHRDTWRSAMLDADPAAYNEQLDAHQQGGKHVYRELRWEKKTFS